MDRMYDVVAYGLGTYARLRYRVRPLGERFVMAPRTLVVSSHRSDDDVPLLVACIYPQAHGHLRKRRGPRLHFAVRDDLFIPGFFAGYPARLPRVVRRALFRVNVGPGLQTLVPCHPIRSATRMRMVEYLRELGDVSLNGKDAQELWRVMTPDELDAPETWARRRAAALEDFRRLVDVVRSGESLVIYPEGRPSPDGTFGPLMDGVSAIVRRARPERIVALAPAYDPLVEGRTHAFLAISAPANPDVDVLALLKRTTPLTVGDSVAAALADRADPVRRLAEDVEAAREERRPYERALDDPELRRRRVEVAVRAAQGRRLDRLVKTYRSARA